MANIWETNFSYKVLRHFVGWSTRRNYSSVKVEGVENIPEDAAVILAPNHCNTLMDALVVLQAMPGPSAFGARADIFKKKTVGQILRFLKIVPLARQRDGANAVMQNLEVFDEVVDIIGHGIPFCIFGEGTHHASHTVQPLKKGLWRIAMMAEDKLDKPVYIVPVGLDYKFFFRCATPLTIRFGEAVKFADVREAGPIKFAENIHGRIQGLVRRPDLDHINEDGSFHFYKSPKTGVAKTLANGVLGLLMLPFAIIWSILALPMTIVSNILIGKMKDKTWSNTVRFGVRFALLIVLTLIYGVLAFIFMKWYWAILFIFILHISDTAFQWHLNWYKDAFIHE